MKIRWYWNPTTKTWWWWLMWMIYQQKTYLLFKTFLSNIKRNDKSSLQSESPWLYIAQKCSYEIKTYGRLSHELRLLDLCYEFSISNEIYQIRKNTLFDRRNDTKKIFKQKKHFWKHRYNGLSHELRPLDLCINFSSQLKSIKIEKIHCLVEGEIQNIYFK